MHVSYAQWSSLMEKICSKTKVVNLDKCVESSKHTADIVCSLSPTSPGGGTQCCWWPLPWSCKQLFWILWCNESAREKSTGSDTLPPVQGWVRLEFPLSNTSSANHSLHMTDRTPNHYCGCMGQMMCDWSNCWISWSQLQKLTCPLADQVIIIFLFTFETSLYFPKAKHRLAKIYH